MQAMYEEITERWRYQMIPSARDARLTESADERNSRLLRGFKRAGVALLDHAFIERNDRDSLVFRLTVPNQTHYGRHVFTKACLTGHDLFLDVLAARHD